MVYEMLGDSYKDTQCLVPIFKEYSIYISHTSIKESITDIGLKSINSLAIRILGH